MKSKMKKWLAGLLVVVLLLVLAGPGLVGMMAEGQYGQVWQNALENEPAMDAEVVDYQRGWFNSESVVEIRLSEPVAAEILVELGLAAEGEDGSAILTLSERVHHGPVPFTAPAPLSQRWRPGFATVDSRPDENLPFIADHGIDIQSTTHLGLLGGVNGHVRVAPFDAEVVPDELRMAIDQPITLDVRSNRNFDRLNARLRSGDIELRDPSDNSGAVLESLWVNADQRRGPANIWLGGTELRVAAMEISGAMGQRTRASGLLWATFTEEREEGLIGQDHEIELQSIDADGFEAGPLSIGMDFFNLHPETLREIQEKLAEAPNLEGSAVADVDAAMQDLLREPIISLMGYRPGMELKSLSLHLPGGEFKGEGLAQVRDLSEQELARHFDRNEIFQLVNAEATFEASRNLVRRGIAFSMMGGLPADDMEEDMADLMDMQIDSAIQEGMLNEREDGQLEVKLELRDGAVLVNEQEMFRF